jgi:hypothetical protein
VNKRLEAAACLTFGRVRSSTRLLARGQCSPDTWAKIVTERLGELYTYATLIGRNRPGTRPDDVVFSAGGCGAAQEAATRAAAAVKALAARYAAGELSPKDLFWEVGLLTDRARETFLAASSST